MTNRTAPVSEQTSNRAIAGVVRRIGTAGKAFNDTVQEGALMVLSHVSQYGDCTGAARIINAMPKTTRRSLLQKWFADFGGINVSVSKGEVKASLYKEGSANYKPRVDLDGARANPWYEIKQAEKNSDLFTAEDMIDRITNLVTRVDNMVNRTEKGEDGSKVYEGDVAKLKAMLKALSAVAKGNTNDNGGEDVAARKTA